jgi:nitric oxide reductase subunit B
MNTSGLNKVIENTNALCEKSRICRNTFKAWVQLDSNNLSDGQQLAVKYFTVAVILFFAQILFGMLAATQFIYPSFLYEIWILVLTA